MFQKMALQNILAVLLALGENLWTLIKLLLSFKYWVLSIPTYMALFSLGIQIYKRNS